MSKFYTDFHPETPQLYALFEGQAGPGVETHVAECPTCRAELAVLQSIGETLGAVDTPKDCPSAHTLLNYEMGFLSESASIPIRTHTHDCLKCKAHLQALRGTHISEEELGGFEGKVPKANPFLAWLKTLPGLALELIPPPQQILIPVRGKEIKTEVDTIPTHLSRRPKEGTGWNCERQAGEYRLSLKVSNQGVLGGWTLRGQLRAIGSNPIDDAKVSVDLRGVDGPISSKTTRFGTFSFSKLPPGQYLLHIKVEGENLILELPRLD